MNSCKDIVQILFLTAIFSCSSAEKTPVKQEKYKSAIHMIEMDADYLCSIKDYPSALYLYNKLVSDYPDTGRFYYKRGKLNAIQDKKTEALSDFRKAIILSDSNNATYFLDRALINIEDKYYSRALEDLEIAVTIDKNCDNCFNSLGICYGYLYEGALATDAFLIALQLNPGNNDYRQNLAIELTRQNKTDTALIVLNEGIKNDSSSASLLFYRAIAHIESGNMKMAKTDLTKCIQLSNKFETICQSQVHYYTLKNNLSTAEFILSVILEFHSDNPKILAEMALVKEYQNDIPDAIIFYQRALGQTHDQTDWLNKLSKLLTIEQRYSESIEIYDKLIAKNSTNTEYYLKRGYAFYKTGKIETAKNDWQKALELGDEKAKEYLDIYFP